MKKIGYKFISVLFIFLLAVGGTNVSAAVELPSFGDGLRKVNSAIVSPDTGLTSENAEGILTNVINFLLSLVAVLALLALIIGGIMYIVSLGDEKRAAQAKQIILYAIIGLIVVGMSFAIIASVEKLLTSD